MLNLILTYSNDTVCTNQYSKQIRFIEMEADRGNDGGVADATTMRYLEKILDLPTEYERKKWDLNLVKDHTTKSISNNYEGICGHYYSLGDGITITSTYMDINATHSERRRGYK